MPLCLVVHQDQLKIWQRSQPVAALEFTWAVTALQFPSLADWRQGRQAKTESLRALPA